MAEIKGKNIDEVWDFRLSSANPILFCDKKYWIVKIFANNGDGMLDEYETDVLTTGNPHEPTGIIACYEYLRTVRDKYALDDIELRKPIVRLINDANNKAHKINMQVEEANFAGDTKLHDTLKEKMQKYIIDANEKIKEAVTVMYKQIKTEVKK